MAANPSDYLTERRYWNLIGRTLGKSANRYPKLDRQEKRLEAELHCLNRDEFTGFLGHHWQLHRAAYRNDLWAVAYVVMGGCSGDCFMDFRNWLVTRSRAVYTAAIQHPDSLSAEFSKIPKGDIPLWEYSYHVLFDDRFGPGACNAAYEKFGHRPFELHDPENKWDSEDDESLRRLCPTVFMRWSDNIRF